MPKRREPLIDHYGTEIKVQPLMGSIGPCVDVERTWSGGAKALEAYDDCDRLTPQQAIELGEWLIEAAEARG